MLHVLNTLFFNILVDRKTVTFDVNSTPRPDTEGQTTPYTGEGTFADDAMTVSSDVEPSVMSSGSYSVHGSKSFISLKPTEQVMFLYCLRALRSKKRP